MNSVAQTWQVVGKVGFSGASLGNVHYTSIAIDTTGTPYVVFRDSRYGGRATVMKDSSGNWVTVGSLDFSAGAAYSTSIAISKSGTPYVVYVDGGNSDKATVMKFNGSSWVTIGSSKGAANYTSIAINKKNDEPYIVFQDNANGNKATVMRDSSGKLVSVGNPGFSANSAYTTSIAIDSSGIPYVLYQDSIFGGKATVMKYNGGTWALVGKAGFSGGGTGYTSIAIDESSKPYVAYRAVGNKATVMKYNDTSWFTLGGSGFSGNTAYYTSIAVDSRGTPYVVYEDYSLSYKATVMKYNGSSWVTEGNAGFTAGDAQFTSIAIDKKGTLYVAYVDGANNGYASVMKFVPPCIQPTKPNLSAASASICTGKSTTLKISKGSLDSATAWHWYSGSCGGLSLGTGDSIKVSPTVTTTYYARGEGGCVTPDSCGSITITVKDTNAISIDDTICSNTSITFNGTKYAAKGTYTATLTNKVGCDSVVTLNLIVKDTSSSKLNIDICSNNSYVFNGTTYSTAGTYSTLLNNKAGCDSTVTLKLTVKNTSASSFNHTICNGSNYPFNGRKLTTSGTYYDTLRNSQSCDSIVTLTLTINATSAKNINRSICAGYSYPFNGKKLTTAGTYFDTLANAQGYDSIVTLNLTVNNSSTNTLSYSVCTGSSIVLNGKKLSVSGTYTDTISNNKGCDSIIILKLIVNAISTSSFSKAICAGKSYAFNGKNITSQGIYYDTLKNYLGCDSVVTLTLTVNKNSNTILNNAICRGDTFRFKGAMLTAAGTYYDTLSNYVLCDSVITLNLKVNPLPMPVIVRHHDTLFTTLPYVHYQWKFDGPNITGGILPYQKLKALGLYAVDVVDSNGCHNLSAPYNDSVLSIHDIAPANSKLLIYPNPNTGYFTLNYSLPANTHTATLHITNLLGEVVDVYSLASQAHTYIIKEATLAEGMYICQLYADGIIIGVTRVVIVK